MRRALRTLLIVTALTFAVVGSFGVARADRYCVEITGFSPQIKRAPAEVSVPERVCVPLP